MTDYNVLFLDIDGTILRPDHTIEDSTKLAVKQAQAKGIEVFLATGRPLHEIADIAESLNIHSFIGYNGALAIYKEEVVVDEPIEPHIIDHFVETAKDHGHEIVFYSSEKNYYTSTEAPIVKAFMDSFQLKKNALFTPAVKSEILSGTLINLTESDPALYEVDADFHFAQVNVEGLEHSYDIIRESVNKGRAIAAVLNLLDFPPETAIAFGDGMNDKEMLRTVGEGFAMGNAHPDLRAYAKHQTTSVTDSGIFNGLKTLGIVE